MKINVCLLTFRLSMHQASWVYSISYHFLITPCFSPMSWSRFLIWKQIYFCVTFYWGKLITFVDWILGWELIQGNKQSFNSKKTCGLPPAAVSLTSRLNSKNNERCVCVCGVGGGGGTKRKRVKEGSSNASLIKVNSQGHPWEEIKTSKLNSPYLSLTNFCFKAWNVTYFHQTQM